MHVLPSLIFAAVEAEPVAGVTSDLINLAPVVLLLPLVGFVFTAFFGRRIGRFAFLVPLLLVVVTWVLAMVLVAQALSGGFGEHGTGVKMFTWIPAGALTVEFGLFVDQLTACLLIVVTTIGMLVHVYSVGYMAHDPARWRFFAYLNLFMFSMLLLILGDSWLTIFAGWELVGLSSYALIGFWYHKRPAALAAKKAFIVNRVGDHAFILGIMLIWAATGTLDIRESTEALVAMDAPILLDAIALLLFGGAVGKSAQFPLHVWLPDAMEGPTPVSALIHAATMVNAGIYLVARSSAIFASAPEAMIVMASIGIFTSILAASIAFTQTDIKRVLAYSTLSQLGLMFASLGVGAFIPAIFHLMTHGFFKGLLFLGSGSVIHAVHDEQDMNRMGGLWRRIPITHWTMFIGALAIAGIPPLAGFFSKDEILAEAFKFGYEWIFFVGLAVAGMTAFYMWRLMGKTFYGESRVDPHVEPRIHESTWTMTVPLVILAFWSISLGMTLGLPLGDSTIKHWLEPVFHEAEVILALNLGEYQLFGVDGVLILVSVAIGTIGMVASWSLFGLFRRRGSPERVARLTNLNGATRFLYRASLNKWWFDELNHLLFIRGGGRIAAFLWWFDRTIVDGTVNGVGTVTRSAGGGLRQIQTGRVQNYALGIAIGLLVMAGSFLVIVGQPR